jgi:IclR family acetate operon transcriptional repressor
VLLAYRPEPEAVLLLEVAGMQRYTERTKTTPAELLPEFALVRQRGWAVDEEEHERSVLCVAAPVFDVQGDACAAVGISGLRWNMEGHGLDLLTQLVQETAGAISRALGGSSAAAASVG